MTNPLVITMGDPSGIGPEIVVKAIAAGAAGPCVVAGSATVIRDTVSALGLDLRINTVSKIEQATGQDDSIDVFETGGDGPYPTGAASAASGRAAYGAILAGIELAKDGRAAGLVTAPIHKEALAAAGLPFPGHTEMLAEFGGSDRVAMMLANGEIRTVLVTIHCSLRDAIDRADHAAQMSAIRLAHDGCRALGIENPRIAVAGLNPHAGEGGLFGQEEAAIIAPAIRAARAEGLDASGPWPGDTVFMQARRGRFDVVVAQYHDQGLIPVKYLGIEDGVNITLGLPFVRTSPDHGTAFDIAGKGIADASSLLTAVTYARRLIATSNTQKEPT